MTIPGQIDKHAFATEYSTAMVSQDFDDGVPCFVEGDRQVPDSGGPPNDKDDRPGKVGKPRKSGNNSGEMFHLVFPIAAPATDVIEGPENDNCPVVRYAEHSPVIRIPGSTKSQVVVEKA